MLFVVFDDGLVGYGNFFKKVGIEYFIFFC